MFHEIPVLIAAFDDIQAIVTVWAGILSENPALSNAYCTKKQVNYKIFTIN